MVLTLSYPVRITNAYHILLPTLNLYRSCVKKLVGVVSENYSVIETLSSKKAQRNIELLVHSTKDHTASYTFFDKEFYKFPSYLRRSAISEAIRIVSSYMEATKQWQELDPAKRGSKPRLNKNQRSMPALYKGNCFRWLDDNHCALKIFFKNDWVWHTFSLSKSDIKYIKKLEISESSPTLEKQGHHFVLRFAFTKSQSMSQSSGRVCSVDLGINTNAVCSKINSDGTVTARKFIDFPVEKDRMNTILGQIRKAQKKGACQTSKLWRFVTYYNREISIKTSHDIVQFAKQHHAGYIVFEHLNIQGKVKGTNKQRLALWRKQDIQTRTELIAHKSGIRISRVCARNTSSLAFDGSGSIIRLHSNRQLCLFQSGKQYNCDLSASYNIGARFFIRERLKTLSATEELAISAKVPELVKRTGGFTTIQSTLSTLINLNAALAPREQAG